LVEFPDHPLSNGLSYRMISISYTRGCDSLVGGSPVPPGPENSRPEDLEPDFSDISQDLSEMTLT
jgi:hypothetical protein